MSKLIGPFVILILAASSYFLAPLAGHLGQNTAWRERVPEQVTAKFCPLEKTWQVLTYFGFQFFCNRPQREIESAFRVP